jgi:uncharacterized membrane protein YccC
MASAYIVAQPLAGAMRSKAVYRLAGTVLGAAVALVLIPNLVDAPPLLVAALALWIGTCVYFGVLDRAPRSYLFLLAGYGVALIGLPAVDAPGGLWDVALARVEEIAFGIGCTALIGSLVFPQPVGPALTARLDAWLRDAAAATVAVLTDDQGEARQPAARRRIGGAYVEIDMMASHLAYDTSHLDRATRPLRLLQQRVMLLLPALSGLDDRLSALRAAGGVTPALAGVLARMAAWIGAADTAHPEEAVALRAAIEAAEPPVDATSDWNTIMLSGVVMRLRELVDLAHDIMELRGQIMTGTPRLPRLAVAPDAAGGPIRFRDHVMALHSAVAVALAIAVLCAFWIVSAWPEGAGAAMLAAVACAFFASQDDPAPGIMQFLYATIVALLLDALYLFVLLPVVDDFTGLVLVLAPAYLLLGALMSLPATARAAGPVTFTAATELALSSSYAADFAAYLNQAVAAIVGLAVTACIVRIVRSVGAEWTVARLLRANRADIAAAARGHLPAGRLAFLTLALDRLSLVVPRLAATAEGADRAGLRAMTDLRVGVNVVDLSHDADTLPAAARAAVQAALRGIAAQYAQHRRPPPPELLRQIDAAIAAVAGSEARDIRDPILRLVGIRRGLFPDWPRFTPETRPEAPPPALRRAA